MFLKFLNISNDAGLVRNIPFKSGLNFIVDSTPKENLKESGNNIGKTTVLRLVDFCLGGDGKVIYQDSEFKERENKRVKDYLIANNVLIELILQDSLNEEEVRQTVIIRRNFLSRKQKIASINGENITDPKKFEKTLKELLFNDKANKPSIRNLIAKNIRFDEFKMTRTLKHINGYTTSEEYEALYLYLFGLEVGENILEEKMELVSALKQEEKLLKGIESEKSKNALEQELELIKRDIDELIKKREAFNISEKFIEDFKALNTIKSEKNRVSSELSESEFRKKITVESISKLQISVSQIDHDALKEIYEEAKFYNSNINKSFKDAVDFHNNMLQKKIIYLEKQIPGLDEKISQSNKNMNLLMEKEKELGKRVSKSISQSDYEEIVTKLNEKHEYRGKVSERLALINRIEESIRKNTDILKEINDLLEKEDFEEAIKNQLKKFNAVFSQISFALYNEHYYITHKYENNVYKFITDNIEANVGSGKKKGEISAFDLAYIVFADQENIPTLHFFMHDKIEDIHTNQLQTLFNLVEKYNVQYIVSVIRDKFDGTSLEEYLEANKILELSQKEKLFKIA